jgi:hypothetical protein
MSITVTFHHHHHHHQQQQQQQQHPLSRIRPLGQFRLRIYFLELMNLFGQLVGLLGRGSARRKASTYTQDNTTQ